nr:tyrosine-type recombinase/integrase [Pseudomonas sp. TAE6080]
MVAKGCLYQLDSAAITLAVYKGIRPGELCTLEVEDVDLDGMQINITRAITANGTFKVPKTGKPRTILLTPPAVDACRTLMSLVAEYP